MIILILCGVFLSEINVIFFPPSFGFMLMLALISVLLLLSCKQTMGENLITTL
jgi:hypothetical protein